MALAIQAETIEGIIETVPTYRSLLIIYNPVILPMEDLKERLKRMEKGLNKLLSQSPMTPNPGL